MSVRAALMRRGSLMRRASVKLHGRDLPSESSSGTVCGSDPWLGRRDGEERERGGGQVGRRG